MNIVAKSDLTFQNFTFTPIQEKGQLWITSTELAKVLKYKKTDAISQIYARNADEFTDAMTMTLNMRVNGINNSLRNKSVRVYSLRGCHLIAMFANTSVAKEFRRWVLDILDREVEQGNVPSQFDFQMAAYHSQAIVCHLNAIKEMWRDGLEDALKLMEYKHRGSISEHLSDMTFHTSPLDEGIRQLSKQRKIH